jgi:hypothetical protein
VNARHGGKTALISAAYWGHTAIVELLLAAPFIDVNANNNWGDNALICVARDGHTPIVELLLAAPGIDVNAKDKKGCTPLLVAAKSEQTGVFELLLSNDRVDHNATNNDGKTAYAIVLENAAKVAPKRSDYVYSDGDWSERILEKMENEFQHAVTSHERNKVLVKTMPKIIARKSWRFLRLCIRIKRGLLRPYRIHKEILSLAKDEWKTHYLNKKKRKRQKRPADNYGIV